VPQRLKQTAETSKTVGKSVPQGLKRLRENYDDENGVP